MHCTVVDEIVRLYKQKRFKLIGSTFGIFCFSTGIPTGAFFMEFPWQVIAGTSTVGMVCSMAMMWYTHHALVDNAKNLISEMSLKRIYSQLYARQIAEHDEFCQSLWSRTLQHISIGISANDINKLNRIKKNETQSINNILDFEIVRLRRLISPALTATNNNNTKGLEGDS